MFICGVYLWISSITEEDFFFTAANVIAKWLLHENDERWGLYETIIFPLCLYTRLYNASKQNEYIESYWRRISFALSNSNEWNMQGKTVSSLKFVLFKNF